MAQELLDEPLSISLAVAQKPQEEKKLQSS